MLTFSAAQMKAAEAGQARRFLERVVERMRAVFPEQLERQPRFVRLAMVGNGLQTASAFGFEQEDTLATFVGLQFETSADFHVLPQAFAILTSAGTEQERINRLMTEVPQETWDTIKRGADLRAWFEPWRPEQKAARIAQRVCHAFPQFAAANPGADLRAFFEQTVARAQRHGIEPEVGIAVYAAALAVYGTTLDEASGPVWATEVFRQPRWPCCDCACWKTPGRSSDGHRLGFPGR